MAQSGTSVVHPAHESSEATMRVPSDVAFGIGSPDYQPFLADVSTFLYPSDMLIRHFTNKQSGTYRSPGYLWRMQQGSQC